jgi:hypothetical protein
MKPQTMTAFANALLAAPAIRPPSPLGAKVDRLGLIRAQMDALALEADDIRDELEAAALPVIEGTFYKASFASCQGATRIDWKTIAERLNPSAQLVRAHTKKSAAYTALKLTAKTPKH